MSQTAFDTDRYLKFQVKKIRSIIQRSRDKLYIEFGGKIIQDRHAARVLPGYREDAKLELIRTLCASGEIIFVVSAKDVLRGRIRGDFKTLYDQETLRTLAEFRTRGLIIRHVVVSLLSLGEEIPEKIRRFSRKLQRLGFATHNSYALHEYPSRAFKINDLENSPFISVKKKVVAIVSPGGGSGKFGVCLSQLYHEMQRGIAPYYLKFETFPVHDLPLDHPVNLAFMAASADFYDVVMRDHRHGKATSYNRDLENYELLNRLAKEFPREGVHLRRLSSATDMGINMLSKGMVDDETIQKEAAAEITRRLVRYKFEVAAGKESPQVLRRIRKILRIL